MMSAINDTFPLLERAVHNPIAIIREFEEEVERLLDEVRASFSMLEGGGASSDDLKGLLKTRPGLSSALVCVHAEHCEPPGQGH